MDEAKRGAAALEASDALAAVTFYTEALVEHPHSPDYFTQRSTAFSRLKPARHDLALRDAEYAVLLGQKRQRREKIQAGQQRRVVSLYGLGRYSEAKQILDSMLRFRRKDSKPDKMEHDMWNARITSKLKGKSNEDQTATKINEYPDIDLPSETAMKKWLVSQLKKDGTFKFDGEEDQSADTKSVSVPTSSGQEERLLDPQDEADVKAAKSEMAAEAAAAQQAQSKVQPIRHDWYQDNSSVTVTFYVKKVDKAKLESKFSDDHMEMTFPYPEASEQTFTFTLDPTFASIDGSSSSAKAFGAKVELKLVKKEKGIKWPALDNKDRPKVDKLPSAWTTKGEQNWDKKATEITEKSKGKKKKNGETGSDSDADSDVGGDGVDSFFKKLYAGADDDTRRAMMKSFSESNGTSLSTNWAEVSKGKVEEVKSKDS